MQLMRCERPNYLFIQNQAASLRFPMIQTRICRSDGDNSSAPRLLDLHRSATFPTHVLTAKWAAWAVKFFP